MELSTRRGHDVARGPTLCVGHCPFHARGDSSRGGRMAERQGIKFSRQQGGIYVIRSLNEQMFGMRAVGEAVAEAEKNVVQSAGKVFAVLRAFDVDHPELTISEVAGRTGLDRGTTFRLIHTLISLGYLTSVPNT